MHYDDAKFTSAPSRTAQGQTRPDQTQTQTRSAPQGGGAWPRGVCAGSVAACAMHSMQINYVTLYAKLFNLLFVARRHLRRLCGNMWMGRQSHCMYSLLAPPSL